MKLSRQFTIFGSAIFCVVIFSLYLMLDRSHLDNAKNRRREGSFPQVSEGREPPRSGVVKEGGGFGGMEREARLASWDAPGKGGENAERSGCKKGGKVARMTQAE